MNKIDEMLQNIAIPPVCKAKQKFCVERLADPARTMTEKLFAKNLPIIKGDRIAITCGSRGIDRYAELVKATVDYLYARGAQPLLIPAMGSHGGATAEGQKDILTHYGITEEAMGAPILSSMETVQIATTQRGLPVYIDKNAYEADGIIILNRVKPHTSFRGTYESGLVKMLAIGLAKHKGAEMTHFLRFENMAQNIIDVGNLALENLKIIGGIASIENGYNKIADIFVLNKEEILPQEPHILTKAAALMPRLYLDKLDVLIVEEIGKEISGTGMDTNIIGRFHTRAASGGPDITMLGILSLSEATGGNANGMGLADFCSRRLSDQIDFTTSYINSLTSTAPGSSKLPAVMNNDKQVLQACLKLCGKQRTEDIKLALIKNTKYLDQIYLSRTAFMAVSEPEQVEKTGDYLAIPFDEKGTLNLF